MTDNIDYWKKFWADKTDPLHTYSDKNYYKNYGKELSVLLAQEGNESILELGCGSGALYKPLGFDKAKSYVGVDLSQSMLDEFHASRPSLPLYLDSADTYKDNNKYNLIFTNGVIQYLSINMLRNQLSNALGMLTDNGIIVHSSVPWKPMKKQYITGNMMPPYKGGSVKKHTLYWALHLGLKKDSMGRWYSVKDFEALAEEFGLNAKFYGSMFYPYRFHVTLKKS